MGAGAVVLERFNCPPYSLVVGNPAYVKKTYDPIIIEKIHRTAASYVERAKYYTRVMQTTSPMAPGGDINSSTPASETHQPGCSERRLQSSVARVALAAAAIAGVGAMIKCRY